MKAIKIEDELLKAAFEKDPFIALIGQSGCGKGTLLNTLVNRYQALLPEKPYLVSETGELFRIATPVMSEWNRGRMSARQNAGYLQQWSAATSMWTNHFLYNYNGGLLFIDGSPRTVYEVHAMVNFYRDYVEKNLLVLFLDVTDEEAERRMIARNDYLIANKSGTPRPDTATPEARTIKLGYFHTLVSPALELLKTIPSVQLISIDASGTKEETASSALRAVQQHVL